ncbi:Uncharacterised protein [Klebsiella pneumoniae]|nr:Uncharacterised protein [Klebsiella pneumoniae]
MLGIHLILNGAQRFQEGVKFLRPVFPRQAENPLQIMGVHRTVMLLLPSQQIPDDVQLGAQGRESGHPVPTVQKGFLGMDQDEA